MPHVVVIAGPNGAGKSTTAPGLLRDYLGISAFVNADEIARGLAAFDTDSVAIEAGRIMLERLRELAARGEDFAFETTPSLRWRTPCSTRGDCTAIQAKSFQSVRFVFAAFRQVAGTRQLIVGRSTHHRGGARFGKADRVRYEHMAITQEGR